MYVKLFGSILDSSIWSTDVATRVVWITMLAMADEFGVVHASVTGLARRAQVSVPECRKALQVLSSPDDDDRSGVQGGRRIEALQGAWQLINYQHYRELRSHKQVVDAARQARHRRRSGDGSQLSVTDHDVTVEAEAEADTEAIPQISPKVVDDEVGEIQKRQTKNLQRDKSRWISEPARIWCERWKVKTAPFGMIGKHLKPLKDNPDLPRRFAAYLAAVNDVQYVSLPKFVATFESWGNGKKAPQTYDYTPGVKGPEL